MRRVLFLIITIITFGAANAQMEKGDVFFEANTGLGSASPSSTGFYFSSTSLDGGGTVTKYNIGVEAGYFIIDQLAIKVGVGYGDNGAETSNTNLGFKIGAKYYLKDKFPIQLDLNGGYNKDVLKNPMFVGLQFGYAFFIGDHVSVEPALRYDYSVNNQYAIKGDIQVAVGFVIHL